MDMNSVETILGILGLFLLLGLAYAFGYINGKYK